MANPKKRSADFERGVKAALKLCAKVRDERPLPKSWPKDWRGGYIAGADVCCCMIINELHPKL